MSVSTYTQYSKLLKAIANAKRIEILHILSDRCVTVSELMHMSGMAQANVSQHLQILRREGIVITKRIGKKITYCLSHPNIVQVLAHVHEILSDRKIIKPLSKQPHLPQQTPLILDPVCGMSVSPRHAVCAFTYKRTTYYFCASGCMKHFKKNPQQYATK